MFAIRSFPRRATAQKILRHGLLSLPQPVRQRMGQDEIAAVSMVVILGLLLFL